MRARDVCDLCGYRTWCLTSDGWQVVSLAPDTDGWRACVECRADLPRIKAAVVSLRAQGYPSAKYPAVRS